MKRQVMNLAWQVCSKFATFAEALTYAWKVVKLRFAMMLGAVSFKFLKVDGSIREAVGTLKDIPATKGGKSSSDVVVYWDLLAEGWRSARVDSLIF